MMARNESTLSLDAIHNDERSLDERLSSREESVEVAISTRVAAMTESVKNRSSSLFIVKKISQPWYILGRDGVAQWLANI